MHKVLCEFLAKYGLKPLEKHSREEFVFGNCDTEISDKCFLYPVFFGGHHCDYLDIARITPECPALIPKGKCKDWEVILDFGKQTTKVQKFAHSAPSSRHLYFWISLIWDRRRTLTGLSRPENFG